MKKKVVKAVIFICICMLLSGCWSSRELTDLAIGTALAIDTHEDGYQITIQVINPGEIAGEFSTTRTAVSTYSATGKTMFETIRKLTTSTPRKVFLSHLRVIVFGEEIAEQGIRKTLDFISRDHEMRTDFAMGIAKGMRAGELIQILTPLEKIPANKVFTSMQTAQNYWAPVKLVTIDELTGAVTTKGKEAVLTGIYATGDPQFGTKLENAERVDSPVSIVLDHLGVFNGDRLVGWLNEKESKGLNYLTTDVKNTVDWVTCGQEGTISFEFIRSTTKLEPSMNNGEPKMTATIKSEVNVGDVECVIDISKPSTISSLEKKVEGKITEIVQASVEAAKGYRSDVFGFGQLIGRKFPKEWEELKQDWPNHFGKLEVAVHVDVKIKRTGTITDSFLEEIEIKNKQMRGR